MGEYRAGLSNVLILLFIAAALFATACGRGAPKGQTLAPSGTEFRIDVSSIGPGDVRFYNYPAGGKTVTFFIARTDSGEFRAAFDACITCFPYRKGYVFDAGRVVCIECGTKYALDELGVGKGNCIPIKIEHRLEDSTLVIDRAVIEAGARWF